METAGSFNQFIFDAIQKYWDQDAMSDYGVSTLQYKDVARKIAKLHILFETMGIKQGEKVAICGRNSSNWSGSWTTRAFSSCAARWKKSPICSASPK